MSKDKNTNLYSIKKNNTDFKNVKISNSKSSADFIRQFYSDDIEVYESFFILLLSINNMTIGYAKISQGGTVGTIVDTKIIAKYAVDSLSPAIVLAHNHPSGNTNPSTKDMMITRKIKEAMELLDCKVVDHIILTKDSYYSFADKGII